MLARERQAKILEAVGDVGAVAVTHLARQLTVTHETIRRDLAKLASEGLIVRTHGGALKPDPEGRDKPFTQRRVTNAEAKRSIGGEAVRLIYPGEVIGIDASSSCFELARQLPFDPDAEPITIITNGIDVARFLAGRRGVRVVTTGGELDDEGSCFIGSMAESVFGQFALTRAFLSCKGFDSKRGPSEASPAHVAIKQAMLAAAEESTLLIDATKLGLRSTCFVAPISRFDRLVTNAAGREAAEAIDGIEIIVSAE